MKSDPGATVIAFPSHLISPGSGKSHKPAYGHEGTTQEREGEGFISNLRDNVEAASAIIQGSFPSKNDDLELEVRSPITSLESILNAGTLAGLTMLQRPSSEEGLAHVNSGSTQAAADKTLVRACGSERAALQEVRLTQVSLINPKEAAVDPFTAMPTAFRTDAAADRSEVYQVFSTSTFQLHVTDLVESVTRGDEEPAGPTEGGTNNPQRSYKVMRKANDRLGSGERHMSALEEVGSLAGKRDADIVEGSTGGNAWPKSAFQADRQPTTTFGIDALPRSPLGDLKPIALQLGDKIVEALRQPFSDSSQPRPDFHKSIRFSLNPEHLGSIEVKMTLRAGKLDISFISEKVETAKSVSQAQDVLRDALAESGIALDNIAISAAPPEQQLTFARNSDGPRSHDHGAAQDLQGRNTSHDNPSDQERSRYGQGWRWKSNEDHARPERENAHGLHVRDGMFL